MTEGILLIGGIGALALGVFWIFLVKKSYFERMLDMVFLRVVLPRKDADADEKRETVRDFKEQVSLAEQLFASFRSIGQESLQSRIF